MARSGMADLITEVRAMTFAGTADYTVAGVAYWTDDQIQDRLDEYRFDYYKVELEMQDEINSGGTTEYFRYYMPDQARWVERAGSASIFRVYEGDGTDPGTANYTVNYGQRNIVFDSDTGGTTYYLDFSAFDLNATAADIWTEKAALVWEEVDWSSDNHRVAASQKEKHAREMAKKYRAKRGMRVVNRVRSDTL